MQRSTKIGTIVSTVLISTSILILFAENSTCFVRNVNNIGWNPVLNRIQFQNERDNRRAFSSSISMSVDEEPKPRIIERPNPTPRRPSPPPRKPTRPVDRAGPLRTPVRKPERAPIGRKPERAPIGGRKPERGPHRSSPKPMQGRTVGIVLQNPMKMQRIMQASGQSDRPRQDNSKSRPNISFNSGNEAPSSPGKANNWKGKNKKEGTKKPDYNKKAPRTQLRLQQTGKRNRNSSRNRRGSLKRRNRSSDKEYKADMALQRRTIQLPEGPLTVGQLCEILDEKPAIIIKFLMTDMGIMAGITQTIDSSTCIAVCEGLGKVVADADDFDEEYDEEDTVLETGFASDEDDEEDLEPRAPVVTIMGHVDHGKTSLLDAIRDTSVTSSEAGGITQHIGAYQVLHNGSPITFIDTPGHSAFSDMRSRGANITDIVILVVASDDGVKQQTVDSIMCARLAGVPLVVAVNKCDLPTADVAKVKGELAGYDILTEDLGGEILCAEVSAKEKLNLNELLTKVMLQAELQELRANPNREAQGVIVEAKVQKGLGAVATTLIQKGTLKVGDYFVAGETSGKVRALIGSDGITKYDEAPPSMPVSVVGFDALPLAGDTLVVAENEQIARELAEARHRITRERESLSYQSSLMASVATAFTGDQKEKREMCVVVKADVQGSAEALARAFRELKRENDEVIVTVKVLVAEAGDVTKSDIAMASVTPDTAVIAFNCASNMAAMDEARVLEVPIDYYNIVYDAIDSVESRMQEVLSPTPDGKYVGKAQVKEVFNIGGTGNIAGSVCVDGIIRKGSIIRLMRGDKIICENTVRTLRNFKAEVDQIEIGDECGIGLSSYEDFQPGDFIESYVDA